MVTYTYRKPPRVTQTTSFKNAQKNSKLEFESKRNFLGMEFSEIPLTLHA